MSGDALRAKKLTAQQAVKVITTFCEAHGREQMTASYGWDTAPDSFPPSERVWSFHSGQDLVGWGLLQLNTHNANDDEAALTVGVFPEHQRSGHRVAILDWMSQKALLLGAAKASMMVLKTNEAHYKRTMREAHQAGSTWVYAGDNWFPPPGFGYFVRLLRE